MGNSVTINAFGVKIKFQSANASDQDKIKGVFQKAGFDKIKEFYDASE